MSDSAHRNAVSFLETNPSREAVQTRIEEMRKHLVWIDLAMGQGMDAGARSSHMTAVEISVCEYWLETGKVPETQWEISDYRSQQRQRAEAEAIRRATEVVGVSTLVQALRQAEKALRVTEPHGNAYIFVKTSLNRIDKP